RSRTSVSRPARAISASRSRWPRRARTTRAVEVTATITSQAAMHAVNPRPTQPQNPSCGQARHAVRTAWRQCAPVPTAVRVTPAVSRLNPPAMPMACHSTSAARGALRGHHARESARVTGSASARLSAKSAPAWIANTTSSSPAQDAPHTGGVGLAHSTQEPGQCGVPVRGLPQRIPHHRSDVVLLRLGGEVGVRPRGLVPAHLLLPAQPVQCRQHRCHREILVGQLACDLARGDPLRVLPQHPQHRSLQLPTTRHASTSRFAVTFWTISPTTPCVPRCYAPSDPLTSSLLRAASLTGTDRLLACLEHLLDISILQLVDAWFYKASSPTQKRSTRCRHSGWHARPTH